MKTKTLSLFALVLLALVSCKKDTITEAYMRGANSLIKTSDGNMLMAGFNVGETGSYDGYLLKVSLTGDVLWSNSYGSVYTDGLYNVINTPDGGYLATGFVSSSTDNQQNLVLIKVTSQGDKSWLTTIGETKNTMGFSVTATADSGFIACGYIQNSYSTDRDIYLVKLNSGGTKVWEKRYGKQGTNYDASVFDEAYSIVRAGDTCFFVTGSMNGNSGCCGTTFLMKIDSHGDSLWTKTFSQGNGYSIAATTDGGAIIGGAKDENGEDICLVKTDANGVKIWEKTYGDSGYDYGTAVIQTSDGGYAITGISTVSSNENIVLVRTDASGTSKWKVSYGDTGIEQGFGLVQHEDGGFSVAGLSNSGGSFIYLNRTDGSGVETWQKNLK